MIGIFRSSVTAGRLPAGPLAAIPLATLLLAAALLLAVPAGAAGGEASGSSPPAAAANDGALPAALDETGIRDMVSRLSDAEAREMLLEQLDALARQQTATTQPDTGLVRDFRGSLQQIREGLAELGAAVPRVPAVGPMLVDGLTGEGDLAMGALLLAAVGIFATALAGEQLFRHLFTAVRPAPAATRAALSFIDRLCILALRLIADLLSLTVFALIAIAIFFVLYTGHEPVRAAFSALLWAIILPRAAAAMGRFAVAPRLPELRLVRLGDGAARAIYRSGVVLVGVIGAVVLLDDVLAAVEIGADIRRLYGTTVSFVILSLIIVWIWRWRRPISRSILEGDETTAPGAQPSRVRQLVAANWHVFAACFIAGIWMMSTLQRLLTKDPPTAPLLISLCILFTVPVADAALRAAVAALLRSPQEEPAGATPPAGSRTIPPSRSRMAYRAVLVRNLRIVLLVIAVVVLARVWDVDMQSMAASGIGETLAEALLEIIIVLVLTSAAWGIVKTAIADAVPERGQAEAEGEISDNGIHFAPRRVIVETATEPPAAARAALAADSEPEARRSGVS